MIKKIIASDIDGTLLPYGERKLNPELFEIIKKLKEIGVLFVPASGRTIQSLVKNFDPVANDISYLSENGGVVWVGKQAIALTPLPKDILINLAETIHNSDTMECYMTSMDRGFVYTDNKDFVDYFNTEMIPGSEWLRDLDDLDEVPVKVTAFCMDPISPKTIQNFEDQFGDQVNVMRAGPEVCDFGIASKGFGLKLLTEYYGLTPDDVYAFGDNYNDKSMLEYATNSYIMRTDDPVLLKSAKYVCDNVIEELKKIYNELKSELD